jgi:hypothetical protein
MVRFGLKRRRGNAGVVWLVSDDVWDEDIVTLEEGAIHEH